MPNLLIKNVNKIYSGGFQAIYDFNLVVNDHDFIVLVGPSGCGKSTMIRMIAGLEEISSGEIVLDGVKINNKAPSDRNVSMVFQDYALYGNMSVYMNIGFPLIIHKSTKKQVYDKVIDAQKIVNLSDDQLMRKPGQLSGGQKQRVALGRAITKDTKLCLMDEPLSNLDAKLRNSMRSEITKLYNTLKQTIIYVTHDQIEAMTMATKMVCMNEGRIQQIGRPYDLYFNPENLFVAKFIGTTPINLINGYIKDGVFYDDIDCKVDLKDTQFDIKNQNNVIIGFRSEMMFPGTSDNFDIKATIIRTEFLGDRQLVYSKYNNDENNIIIASIITRYELARESVIYFKLDYKKIRLFNSIDGKKINMRSN